MTGVLLSFFRRLGIAGGLSFGLSLLTYILLFERRVLLDITAQVQTLLRVCDGEVVLPPMPVFYGAVWLLALGQCHFTLLMGAAALVLALSATATFWVTRFIFEDYFQSKTGIPHKAASPALALGWVCSLPTADLWRHGWYIIGQPSPNYWMNGTYCVSVPFALALFWCSYRQLQEPRPGGWRRQLLWIVLLILAKPSYFFVYAVTFPLFALWAQGLTIRRIGRLLWPVAIGGLLIALQYYFVFSDANSVYVRVFNQGNASGVVIRPFAVWRLHSSNISVSVLAGAVFPLCVAALYWKECRRRLLFQYAWAGFAVALLISALFMQTGAEYYTWAFRFQQYTAAYILFLVSALVVWEKTEGKRPEGWRSWICVILFGLHLLSGMAYVVKMLWTKSHY